MTPVAIYKVTNILNGKMYIGQSTDPRRRFAEHISRDCEKCGLHSRIGRALKKHGKEKFEFTVLCWCPDKTYADMVEIKLIEAHDTRRVGYNICVGGEGLGSGTDHPKYGRKESEESRRKKSHARLGARNPNYGKKLTPATLSKLSAARKGRIISPEWRAKISEANKGKRYVSAEQMSIAIRSAVEKTSQPVQASRGSETLMFASIKEAARSFEVADVTIGRWLRKSTPNRDGWIFLKIGKNGD
jgi:group I intron endonuclease